jgi:hypothetical protein
MVDLCVLGMSVVLWTVTIVRWREPTRSVTARWWLRLTFSCLAIASTLVITGVSAWLTTVTGVRDLSEPIARTGMLAAAFGGLSLMDELTREVPRSRSAVWARTSCLLASIGLLWLAFVVGRDDGVRRFASYADASLWPAVFLIVFMGYFGYAVAGVMTGCHRYARSAHGALSTGLHLIVVGCVLGLSYVAVKLGAELLALSGTPIPPVAEATVGRSFGAVGAMLVAVGASWPTLARLGGAVGEWMHTYRMHWQLRPLWSALIASSPGLALERPAAGLVDSLRVRDLHLRLYRRVIEIRDAQMVLRPFLSHQVRESASAAALSLSLEGLEADAFVEARQLEAALASTEPASEPDSLRPLQEGSLRSEAEWLVAVAGAFHAPSARATRHTRWSPSRGGVA